MHFSNLYFGIRSVNMNDESLKNQLELIQNQQKQRLIKKNQLKLKKEDESGQTENKPSLNATENASSDFNGFEEVEDNLDLKVVDFHKDIYIFT